MSSFPGSPRLIKGALIAIDPLVPIPNVILFQYNPDTMTRRLDARSTSGDNSDRAEAFRLIGPPKETITLSVEIDATDQLERNDSRAATVGIHPALAALEVLLYPASETIIQNAGLAKNGEMDVMPPEAPLSLLVWGPLRVLPVRLTGFSVTEEAYDTALNPIRAKVELSMQVLSTLDLKTDHIGYELFMAHHIAKEILAKSNLGGSPLNLGASVRLF
ncbi:MAG: hypothetical protein ACREOO_30475 [bacterium]